MQIQKRFLLLVIAPLAVASLSGCTSLSVGKEEFACTGMPGSVYCHSARDVYEKTNDGVVPSPVGRAEGSYNDDCTDCVRAESANPDLVIQEDDNSRHAVSKPARQTSERIAMIDKKTGQRMTVRRQTLEVQDDEVINNYVAPRLPSEPVPLRTPSQVMRIWVAPYVDVNGDLVAPGYVYTEIEPRRWIYPSDEQGGNSRAFAPLEVAPAYPNWHSKTSEPAYNSLDKFKHARKRNAHDITN